MADEIAGRVNIEVTADGSKARADNAQTTQSLAQVTGAEDKLSAAQEAAKARLEQRIAQQTLHLNALIAIRDATVATADAEQKLSEADLAAIASVTGLTDAEILARTAGENRVSLMQAQLDAQAKLTEANIAAAASADTEAAAATAVSDSAARQSEYFGQLQARVSAVKIELADLAEILDTDNVSLDQAAVAVGRATVLFAELRQTVEALQATGQAVPESVIVSLKAAGAQVAALTEQYHGLAAAEEEAAAGVGAATTKMATSVTTTSGLRKAFLGVTESIGGLLGAVAPWLIALTLLPTLVNQAVTAYKDLSGAIAKGRDKLADWIEGVNEAVTVERKKNETDDEYAERVRVATDLQQKATEAQHAMNAGVIAQTDNVKLATVAWIAHEIALHPTPQLYAQLAAAMKAAGLQMVETFDDVKAKAAAVSTALQVALAVGGVKAAETWAAKNVSLVKEVIQGYDDFGQKVPPDIQRAADALDVHSRAQERAIKLQKEYRDTLQKASDQWVEAVPKIAALSLEVERNAEEYTKSTAAIETHRQETNRAIESETKSTVEGIFQQIDSIKSRGLSQEQASAEENRLLGEITKVRTDALNRELENNAKSKEDQDALDKREAEQLIKFQERAKAQGTSLEALGAMKDALKDKVVDLTGKIEEELKQHGLAAAAAVAAGDRLATGATPKFMNHAEIVERVNAALRDSPKALDAFIGSFDSAGGAVDRFTEKLMALEAAVDRAVGGTSPSPGATGGTAGGGGSSEIAGPSGGDRF